MKTQRGISFVELLAALAIIGILASIAIPNFRSDIEKSTRKSEGMPALLSVMQAQDNYYANKFTYTTDLRNLNFPATYTSDGGNYQITAATCDDGSGISACVKLIATGIAGQASDGNLTLDSRGNKTYKGNNGWPL